MIDLTGATAAVSTTWYTTQYTPICSPGAFDSYMRDVEMSPDGSFFVVATTGGPHSGTLCDAASRFETYAVGTDAHADVDQQLRRRHPVGRRDHPGGGLRRRPHAVDEQPQRRRQRRPGLGAAARSGRARPAERRPAQVEPRPQPARRGGLRDLRDRRRHLDRQRHRLDRRPPLPAAAHLLLPVQRGHQHRVEEHRFAAGQRVRRRAAVRQQRALPRQRRRRRDRLARQRTGLGRGHQRRHQPAPQHRQHDGDAQRADRRQPGQRPGVHAARHLDPGAQRPDRRQRDAVDVPRHRRDQHPGAAVLRRAGPARRGASTCSSTASPSCRTTTPTSTRASTRAP